MTAASTITQTFRAHGLRVTAQRLAVAAAVAEHGRHQTADEVYARVRRDLPAISLTTVYKILNELVELGRAQRVALGDGVLRFDPNVAPHAHLVCQGCGATEDLLAEEYYAGLPAVASRGYQITHHAVVFVGVCPRCQAGTMAGVRTD